MATAKTKKRGKSREAATVKAQRAEKARTRDSLQALSKLAEGVDGTYRIESQPPVVGPAP